MFPTFLLSVLVCWYTNPTARGVYSSRYLSLLGDGNNDGRLNVQAPHRRIFSCRAVATGMSSQRGFRRKSTQDDAVCYALGSRGGMVMVCCFGTVDVRMVRWSVDSGEVRLDWGCGWGARVGWELDGGMGGWRSWVGVERVECDGFVLLCRSGECAASGYGGLVRFGIITGLWQS